MFKRLQRAWMLERISCDLERSSLGRVLAKGRFITVEDIWQAGDEADAALDRLFDLVSSHQGTRMVLERHRIDRSGFNELYWRLASAGLGQRVGGYYVAAAALAFVPTLDYIIRRMLKARTQEDVEHATIRIVKYFHNGLVGELREPYAEADSDSLEALQEVMHDPIRYSKGFVTLAELRQQFAGSTFKDMIQHHINRQGRSGIGEAVLATMRMMSSEEKEVGEVLIDDYNIWAYERDFWKKDCASVLDEICALGMAKLRVKGQSPTGESLFNLFQVIVLNFALTALDDKGFRKYAGIRIGWL